MNKGFTLVELLVVVVILAILTTIGVATYTNIAPRTRDTARISHMTALKDAISAFLQNSSGSAADLCFNLTTPCSGSSFPLTASTKNVNGAGWVKMNFASKNIVNLPTLPVDPINDASFFYQYSSDGVGWKISTVLEKDTSRMQNDGGSDANRYEIGVF